MAVDIRNVVIMICCIHGFLLATSTIQSELDDLPPCPTEQTNESVFIPNFENCSTFFQCSNGVPILQVCPPGLEFNMNLRVCDTPYNAKCPQGENPSIPSLLYPINCGSAKIVPDPKNCSSFLYCVEGEYAYMFYCPFGLLFNPNLLVCDFPGNVQCKLGGGGSVGAWWFN